MGIKILSFWIEGDKISFRRINFLPKREFMLKKQKLVSVLPEDLIKNRGRGN